MSAKQAIKDERKKLVEESKRLGERQADVDRRVEALDAALAALSGSGLKPEPGKTRTRTYRGRESAEKRRQQVLEAIQAKPKGTRVTATDLDKDDDIPQASAQAAIEALLGMGELRKVDETPRGKPIVELRATSVKPGVPPRRIGQPEPAPEVGGGPTEEEQATALAEAAQDRPAG